MALLTGTARKMALDLLRSGRAFDDNGVGLFKKAYKATQRSDAPQEVVSEFRNLLNNLKAEASSTNAFYRRRYGAAAKTPEKRREKVLFNVRTWIGDEGDDVFTDLLTPQMSRNRADLLAREAELAQYPDQRRRMLRDANINRLDAGVRESLIRLFGAEP